MVYYDEKDNELLLDFLTIRKQTSIPVSTLYRKIRKKLIGIRYKNQILYRYKDLLLYFPDIFKEIQLNENLK